MKHLILSAALLASGLAQASPLFMNAADFVGSNGLSVLNSTAGDGTLGFAANSNFRVAEDFKVTGNGWHVQSLDFFAYQTGGNGFTFTGATWQIKSGDVNSGQIIASGSNEVSNGGSVGYRVTSTTLSNTSRNIYRIQVDIPDIDLFAGDYWMIWSLTGTSASGPFAPSLVTPGGNAQQGPVNGLFAQVLDGGSSRAVELPFAVNGSLLPQSNAVPEPSGLLLTALAGLAMLASKRRRR